MAKEKLKRISREQLAFLEKYKDNFRTANEGGWSRHLPDGADKIMAGIIESATGRAYPYKRGCGSCVVTLLRDASKVYEYEKALSAEEVAAAAAETPAPAPVKKKTSKKK